MTREETKKIMAALRVSYPMYYQGLSREDLSNAVNLWAEMFADDPARDVAAAVKAYMTSDVKGFPPSIGQIKTKLRMIARNEADILTETAAWAMIRKAIANSGYHAQEEYERLPESLKACVTPDLLRSWALDETSSEQVIASNLMRSYRDSAKRQEEYDALPPDIKKMIASLSLPEA